MNLNRLRLGQKSRKKNYKIKSCQSDMIECNCDNLHTFTYSVFVYVILHTNLHPYIKGTKIGKIFGSWDRVWSPNLGAQNWVEVRESLVLEEIRLNYLNLEDTSDEWSLRIFILHSSSQKAFDSSKTINIQFNQDFLYFVTTLALT